MLGGVSGWGLVRWEGMAHYGITSPRARRRLRIKIVRQERVGDEVFVMVAAASWVSRGSLFVVIGAASWASRGSSELLSLSGVTIPLLLEKFPRESLNGPCGSTMKKLTSMMAGRNDEAKRLFRTLKPRVVVAKEYAPAPTNPAPPVPLPHAARLKGP